MRLILLFIFLLPVLSFGSPQIYQIESNKNGFLNVRDKANIKSNQITKLLKGDLIISSTDPNKKWLSIVGFDKDKNARIFHIRNKSEYVKSLPKSPKLTSLKTPTLVFPRPGVSVNECTESNKDFCPQKIEGKALIRFKHSELIEMSDGWKLYYQVVFAFRDKANDKLVSGKGWIDASSLSAVP